MAICVQCGEEFTPKDTRNNKVCSHSCAAKLRYKNNDTESAFAEKFNEMYKGEFEYCGGYNGSDGTFKRMCLKCGEVTERNPQCIRSGHERCSCASCSRLQREAKKEQERVCKTERKTAIKELRLSEREQKLISVCSECGNTFKADRAGKKYCSIECVNKHNNRCSEISRRHKIRENGVIHWNIGLRKLVMRDGCICHICGKRVNMNADTNANEYGSIDHVIPVSKGGTHTWDNVKLAHRGCNSIKNSKVFYENKKGQLVLYV